MKGEYNSEGKSTAWKEIFHITSAMTFTQTLCMGAAEKPNQPDAANRPAERLNEEL